MARLSATEVELFSVAGLDGYLREVNAAFATLLGTDRISLEETSILELVHPHDVPAVVEGLAALSSGAAEVLVESRFRHRNGDWVYLQWVARTMPGTDLWWASGRDTTPFHHLLAERTDLWARLELAAGPAVAMWDLDVASGTLTWDPHGSPLFGSGPSQAPVTVGDLAHALHPQDAEPVSAAWSRLNAVDTFEVGARLGHDELARHVSLRAKVVTRDRRGRPARVVGILLDVSTEKALEEQMLRMVMHDALTGVPNRRAFDQALRGECRRAGRSLHPISVLMIDLDDFKSYNDSFGHLVGDDALCALARALSGTVHREGDLLARFGGEEFAVVLPGADVDAALAVAERILEAARSVTVHQAAGRRLSVSVGTATWAPEGQPIKPAALLARADQALAAAKAGGKDQALAYEHSVAGEDALQEAIASGLQAGEFELYYQPVLALATGSIWGFEALIRWNRPDHGMVPPDQFIPVAEKSTLINDLGRWVLHQACAQFALWARDGLDDALQLHVAVNVSARHVNSPAIVADVRDALEAAGLAASRLEIELTETALTDRRAGHHLAELRRLGATVAIDDFGTGYTSIGRLRQLPVDVLKIDRSFVSSTVLRQQALVPLMVGAARAFDLAVVAEGIEDQATLDLMRDLGCDLAQGYHLARPMPATAIPGWVAEHARSAS